MNGFKIFIESDLNVDNWLRQIIDNPQDLTNYLVFADWIEENFNSDMGQLLRLLIDYQTRTGPDKTKTTNQIKSLAQKNSALFDKVSHITQDREAKKIMLHFRPDKGEDYGDVFTYDQRRDANYHPNIHPQFAKHPTPHDSFIQSIKGRGFTTGPSSSHFPPHVLPTMVFYLLLANNPQLLQVIRQSKALSRLKPFGATIEG